MHSADQVKAFFDARAPQWDANCSHDPRKLEAVATLADVRPGCRVLDIACGTGVLEPVLLARGAERVTAIDLSEQMIARAREKCGDPRVEFLAGDILEFAQTGFDVAIIYSAYPHFADKEVLARQVWQALAPGGRFIVAHSESRATINGRHHSPAVQAVSTELRPAMEELKAWQGRFTIDQVGDSAHLYFFSGVKK